MPTETEQFAIIGRLALLVHQLSNQSFLGTTAEKDAYERAADRLFEACERYLSEHAHSVSVLTQQQPERKGGA